MKGLKNITILGILCLSTMIATSVFATNTAKVNAETARIRSKANTTSSIITLVSMNETVDVLEEDGEWCKVKYKGKTGYVSKELLDLETDKKSNKTNTSDANNEKTQNTTETTSNNEEKKQSTEENVTNPENNEANMNNETEEKNGNSNNNQKEITEGIKCKLSSKVEIRIVPLINSTKIGTIDENTEIEVKEVINNWCSIKTDNAYGWILKSQIENEEIINNTEIDNQQNGKIEENNETTTEEVIKQDDTKEETKTEETTNKKGYVNVDTVNVRKEKSTTSSIITNLNKNAEVEILGEEDNWTKIKVKSSTGYIASKYISDKKVESTTSRGNDEERKPNALSDTNTSNEVTQPETSTVQSSETTSSNSSNTTNTTTSSSKNGSAVVSYAKQFLGCKYVSGGNGPKAFDCSGFTSYVYKHFGVTLSRNSSGQRSNGKKVEKSNLQPGDIVCFTGHVGIYIGGNKFIHAANQRKGVIITSMSDSYYVKNYITARRIF